MTPARLALAALLLGSAAPADAALVVRPVNVTLTADPFGANSQFDLDLDQDGLDDFRFTTAIGDPADPTFASFATVDTLSFGSADGFVVDAPGAGGFPTVSRLGVGDTVGPPSLFSFTGDQGNLFFVTVFDPPSGNFEGRTGFVGLRVQKGNAFVYGYAQVTLNDLFAPTDPLALTIGVVGFESVAGAPAAIVPEPMSVVLAGVGAAVLGTRARRRK